MGNERHNVFHEIRRAAILAKPVMGKLTNFRGGTPTPLARFVIASRHFLSLTLSLRSISFSEGVRYIPPPKNCLPGIPRLRSIL